MGPQRSRLSHLASALGVLVAVGCGAEIDGVPPGAVARVGDRVVTPEALEAQHANLGAYGQRRFAGQEGRRALLDGAITQVLLELEAASLGLDHHPRVAWAEREELARLQLMAELERRVPTHDVREDKAALRAYYEAHLAEFSDPEKRSAQMVQFETLVEADAALERVLAGEVQFEGLGELVQAELLPRDDQRYPGLHRLLFDEAKQVGDVLPAAVVASERIWVARLHEIQPAVPRPFLDPAVQEELVSAVRAPRADKARLELMAELEKQYPLENPG